MEKNQKHNDCGDSVSCETFKSNLLEYLCKVSQGVNQENCDVSGVQYDKGEEVLMIAIPQTRIDEWTMVVKSFNTSVADHAVERSI